jgi:hypothetical protein
LGVSPGLGIPPGLFGLVGIVELGFGDTATGGEVGVGDGTTPLSPVAAARFAMSSSTNNGKEPCKKRE